MLAAGAIAANRAQVLGAAQRMIGRIGRSRFGAARRRGRYRLLHLAVAARTAGAAARVAVAAAATAANRREAAHHGAVQHRHVRFHVHFQVGLEVGRRDRSHLANQRVVDACGCGNNNTNIDLAT